MDESKIKQIQQIIENEFRKPIITEFIPQLIFKDNEYNTLITELDRGYKGCNESISKVYPAIKEEYYNFILSLKCKIYLVNNDQVNPLAIYNSDNEFVGVVLPVYTKDNTINESQNYNEYLDQLKADQEVKKLRQENLKKCLYIRDNKAIVRGKELISIADIINDESYNNLYIEKIDRQDACVYLDLGIVCLDVRYSIDKQMTKYQYQFDRIKHLQSITLDQLLEDIRNKKVDNQFVNVTDIKLIELSGATQKEIQELIDYRQEWYNRRHQEEQEKRLKREQEDKEYVEAKNKIIEDLVLAAEQAILNKQEVWNNDITIYKSRYDNHNISLILYMMKQYNINIPLKTQGWINQALTSIQYNEEWKDYSYKYYKSSSNSTVFRKYLNQLIKVIQEKYAVVSMI